VLNKPVIILTTEMWTVKSASCTPEKNQYYLFDSVHFCTF